MDISKISTSVLKSILSLTERRESLLSELGKIEASITSVLTGKAVTVKKTPARRGRKPNAAKAAAPAAAKPVLGKRGRKPQRASRRGALKDSILAALRSAGDKGISVKELSEKLGVKNQNVHVWFSSTGRKLGTVQKIAAGRYRLKGA